MARPAADVISLNLNSRIGRLDNKSDVLPFLHRPHETIAPLVHSRELLSVASGSLALGQTCSFNMPITIDALREVQLRLDLPALTGAAVFKRYVDAVAIRVIDWIEVRYGNQVLQRLVPDDIVNYTNMYYSDEDRATFYDLVGGHLSPVERSARAAAVQTVRLPIAPMLRLDERRLPDGAICTRGLSEPIKVFIKLVTADKIIEASTVAAADVLANTIDFTSTSSFNSSFLASTSGLYAHGYTFDDDMSRALEAQSKLEHRYIFDEFAGGTNSTNWAAATALDGTQKVNLAIREFSIPIKMVTLHARWQADLERVAGGASGTYGTNYGNYAAWYRPGGASQSLIGAVALKAGANIFIQDTEDPEQLMKMERRRLLKGSSTSRAAIIPIGFALDPWADNALYGFLDFAQSDNISMDVTTRNIASTYATIGTAAIADIGVSSALNLQVQPIAHNAIQMGNRAVAKQYTF